MSHKRLVCFLCSCIAFLTSGCAGGQYLSAAKTAETRNDPARAYEQYCRAAASDPGNAAAADGINRTRAAAAAYWERSGLAAMDAQRYEDAWRCFMRVLDIQPDHATATQMIRQLEQTQPQRVALVREEYMRHGAAALRSVQGTKAGTAEEAADAESDTQLAQATKPQKGHASGVLAAPLGSASGKTSPPSAVTAAKQESVIPPEPEADSPPIAVPSKYVVTKTFSRKDQRFPQRAIAVDGIELDLRDTDENGRKIDVDIDLYKNGERIKKIRGLPVGRSQSFRGESGHVWRLTVLSAHQKTHTVRIGFRGVGQ